MKKISTKHIFICILFIILVLFIPKQIKRRLTEPREDITRTTTRGVEDVTTKQNCFLLVNLDT